MYSATNPLTLKCLASGGADRYNNRRSGFGTSPADHVGLGHASPRLLDREQPALETIPNHAFEM